MSCGDEKPAFVQRKAASDFLSAKDMGPPPSPCGTQGAPAHGANAASPASPCVTAPHDPGQLQSPDVLGAGPPLLLPLNTASSMATGSLHSPITIVLCNCYRQGPKMEAFSLAGPSWGWLVPARAMLGGLELGNRGAEGHSLHVAPTTSTALGAQSPPGPAPEHPSCPWGRGWSIGSGYHLQHRCRWASCLYKSAHAAKGSSAGRGARGLPGAQLQQLLSERSSQKGPALCCFVSWNNSSSETKARSASLPHVPGESGL